MLEYAGCEQLDLIGRRPAAGILERDDLALLGQPEAPLNRSRWLSRDRASRGCPAPADGPSPAVKEHDRYAAFTAQPRQLDLGLRKLPIRGEEPAVLVRVRIANHHLVHAALRAHAATDQGNLEEIPHDVRRPPQVLDR